MVREKDWARIRRRIDSAQKHRREFAAFGWACIGVAVSAVFSAMSWEPAYRVLPPDQRPDFAWVWPAILAIGISGLVVAAFMFRAAHISAGAEGVSIRDVLEDMDEIHPRPGARPSRPAVTERLRKYRLLRWFTRTEPTKEESAPPFTGWGAFVASGDRKGFGPPPDF
ncbi:hypothetical protein [Arthrobacter sp. UYCu712]|uniref:hypothetical protein n=1 Tax=Arthrobacter sp. UYCu712 TaxID=3156340 RepID=UPI003390B2B3